MRTPALIVFGSLWCMVQVGAANTDSSHCVYVFVALADNEHQGIVPVPAQLGDGDDPRNNLYWGAAYGVKTYLKREAGWKLIATETDVRPDTVLEQSLFEYIPLHLSVTAFAYKGERIKTAVKEFLDCVAGRVPPTPRAWSDSALSTCQPPDLVAYVGHDGLMDFYLTLDSLGADSTGNQTIILACASRPYFDDYIKGVRGDPVLWTTGLMAPEAYTLEAALKAWAEGKDRSQIREAAATAYDRFQHCGLGAARRLLVSGF